MNIKSGQNVPDHPANFFKNMLLKLFRNPAYYNIKLQSKYRGRDRNKRQV